MRYDRKTHAPRYILVRSKRAAGTDRTKVKRRSDKTKEGVLCFPLQLSSFPSRVTRFVMQSIRFWWPRFDSMEIVFLLNSFFSLFWCLLKDDVVKFGRWAPKLNFFVLLLNQPVVVLCLGTILCSSLGNFIQILNYLKNFS